MAFRVPNRADAAYLRQAGLYSSEFDTVAQALAGDVVISGLGVSAQGSPDMTVAVAAGMSRIAGYFAYKAGENVAIAAAHATLDRIDLIVIDWNGALSRVAGTAALRPVTPAIPANSLQLAQVYVAAAVTSITSGAIIDKRPAGVDSYDIWAEFMGSNLSNTAATSAGSIGECAWTMSGTTAAPVFQSSVAGKPGILRSATGATSGNRTSLHHGSAANSAMVAPADVTRMTFGVSIPTITTMSAKFGLGQDLSVATVDQLGTAGAWVEFVPASSAKWRYVTRQASVSTANADTGADVVAGSWYRFDIIRKQNGNVQFLKNGILQFEHSTNLPTTVCNIGTTVHTLTTAARNLDHDYYGLSLAPLGNRWS